MKSKCSENYLPRAPGKTHQIIKLRTGSAIRMKARLTICDFFHAYQWNLAEVVEPEGAATPAPPAVEAHIAGK